jgi:hypothetical protein
LSTHRLALRSARAQADFSLAAMAGKSGPKVATLSRLDASEVVMMAATKVAR